MLTTDAKLDKDWDYLVTCEDLIKRNNKSNIKDVLDFDRKLEKAIKDK